MNLLERSIWSVLPQRFQSVSILSIVFCNIGSVSIFIVGFNEKLTPRCETLRITKNTRPGVKIIDIPIRLDLKKESEKKSTNMLHLVFEFEKLLRKRNSFDSCHIIDDIVLIWIGRKSSIHRSSCVLDQLWET